MLKKMKNNKKGFTLVELIVVLVILAILAALLIPALTGYIDKAKNKSIVAETRQVVMASQTLVDEYYAKQDVNAKVTVGTADTSNVKIADIATLAEVKGTISSVEVGTTKTTDAKNETSNAGIVTKVVYTNKGKTCTYTYDATNGTDGAYDVK